MRRFLLPASAVLLSLFVVSSVLHAEDAPRAPRSARRAARRAARQAEAVSSNRNGLADGLHSAGSHASPPPRLAAHELVFDESEMMVVTSSDSLPFWTNVWLKRRFPALNQSDWLFVPAEICQSQLPEPPELTAPPAPWQEIKLREGVFPVTSEPNPIAVTGNLAQSEEFLESSAPVRFNEGRFEVSTGEEVHGPLYGIPSDVAAVAPASRPILQDASSTADVLSGVVVAGELAGLVLPEPGRLDPSILQTSFNQLPVAVSGAIAFADETPPPLPPPEKTAKPAPAANLVREDIGPGCVFTFDKTRSVGISVEEARVWAALDQPVSLHFEQVRLEEIFRHIANSQGINIVIDDTGLAEVGVTTNDHVSVNVDGVTLRSALNLILDARDLAWLIDDEVLKITSRQRSEGELFTQVYTVADLIRPISPSGSAGSEGEEPPVSTATVDPDFDHVTALIRTFVQPDSWNESGGPAAMVPHAGSRSLVVRQTRRGHQEVVALLGCVRQIIRDIESSRSDDESSIDDNAVRHVAWNSTTDSEGSSVRNAAKSAAHSSIAPGPESLQKNSLRSNEADNRLQRLLGQAVSLHFYEAPLEDVLEHIARTLFIDVVIDDRALAAVGVNSKSLVSFDVDGIVCRSALNLLLKPLHLEYRVQDEVLMITSREPDERVRTRVYAVPDLATPIQWYHSDRKSPEDDRKIECDSLIEFIKTTISPDDWVEFGGRGQIEYHDETLSLVVRQSERAHREIADLLEQLRQLREVEISLELSAVRISRADFARIKSEWGADWYGNRVDAAADQFKRLTLLLDGAEQTTVVRPGRITMYEGQTWRVAAVNECDSPFAFVTAISSAGRRSVDCNIAVPRTIDGKQMLERVSVFTTRVGNTCVFNASEPSPVIEEAFSTGSFSRFGDIREMAPGEGDGVVWDDSPDGVTLVFITPRIIAPEKEEARPAPKAHLSETSPPGPRQTPAVITVTPRIIIQEEEEELLGIPTGASSEDAHPTDQGPQPLTPSHILPDSFDVFGIPTHDLLFHKEEPPQLQWLILQSP